MDKFLLISRWLLHKLFIALLGATVWLFIPALAFSVNFTDASQVKTWLNDSNTYELLISEGVAFVEASEDEILSEKTRNSAIDDQALLESIKPALQAEFVQTQIEEAIDNTYAWFRSEASQPNINLSLQEKSDEIESALAAELTTQLSALPACTSLDQINRAENNILELECLPPGVSASLLANKFANDFVNQEDGLVQAAFTDEDLNLGNTTKASMPILFNTLELLPMFFWAFLASFSVIVLVTSRSLQRGLKEVGGSLAIASGLLMGLSFVAARLSSAPGKYLVDPDNIDAQSQASRNVIEPLAKTITTDVSGTAMFFAGVVFAIGVAIFGIGWYMSRDDTTKPNSDDNQDDVPELMRDDNDGNFIDRAHEEKNTKPKKIKDKIKKRLVQ